MKNLISKIAVLSLLAVFTLSLTACGGTKELSSSEVTELINTFESPTVLQATFTQEYELSINDDRAFLQSFAKEVDDVVTIHLDLSEDNIYYYGKRVSGDEILEQLLVKNASGYVYYTTITAEETLTSDADALEKISELLVALTRQTAGFIDLEAFTYSDTWIQDYVLLGSENVDYLDDQYFTYTFEKTRDSHLLINGQLDLVGYFGDMGTFEFGVDDTHLGSTVEIETNNLGQITSFNQTLSNHLDMALFDPAAPLDLEGTRSLEVEYGGTLTMKTEINQELVTTATIVLPEVTNGSVSSYDFKLDDISTLDMSSLVVSEGNLVAIKVELTEGEVEKVTVNGNDTELTYGYYVYMTPAIAGETYTVEIIYVDQEEVINGTIVLPTIDGMVIESFDFEADNFATLSTTSLTVTPGNFVAIKITTTSVITSVRINGSETTNINGYYVLMTPAVAGETYTVEINGTIVLPTIDGMEIVSYDFEENNYATLEVPSLTVTPGNFVAVKITTTSTITSVLINGVAATNINGYYVLMTPAVIGITYTVEVISE